jgi:hypothetical protein
MNVGIAPANADIGSPPQHFSSSVANLLVKQHGDEAQIEAAMHADAMLEKGSLDGQVVWLRIFKAVTELLDTRPGDAVAVH